MQPQDEQTQRERVWSAAKTAVHAYAKDPSDANAGRVRRACHHLREMRERALAAQLALCAGPPQAREDDPEEGPEDGHEEGPGKDRKAG